MKSIIATLCFVSCPPALGYAFVQPNGVQTSIAHHGPKQFPAVHRIGRRTPSSSLFMVDTNVLIGGGIAVAGTVAGIGLVVFAENMGERAKTRGVGLSDGMTTKITGKLMEDVEVDSVANLSSLTSQLEQALKATGGAKEGELKMSEEDKKRIADEADDGW